MNLTHLSFADHIIIFTDGKGDSITGIANVLKEFECESGLAINMMKSALFMAGKTNHELQERASMLGLSIEQLPIRYLGLPLTTKSMTKTDYEPLVDRIRKRLITWSSKTLSYAGRLQLINSVIASIANFWSSAFCLPKRCLETIEKMCNAFLWSGSPHISSKAKVAWEDICFSKREGGLGIRRMQDMSKAFSLKLIWRLFEAAGSLWVAWTRCYLMRENSFWDLSEKTTRGSWMWKKLLKMRPLAATFIKSEVRDGKTTSFWFDTWLSVEPLIHVFGEVGTRILGVKRKAMVADAVDDNAWKIRRPRGLHLQATMNIIMTATPPSSANGLDLTLWRQGNNKYEAKFTTRTTWEQLRNAHSLVLWHRLQWFPQSIPRHAFISSIAFQNRLSTGDRMRQWGATQPCLFCGELNETRDHLFFVCPYSYTIWTLLVGKLLGSRINPDWNATVTSLSRNRLSNLDSNLAKRAFQSTVYGVWRKRNGRRNNRPSHSPLHLAYIVHKDLQHQILSCKRNGVDEADAGLNRWIEISRLPTS